MTGHTWGRYDPEVVSSPGEILEELLEEREMSAIELARRMGRPVRTIKAILKGRAPVTMGIAHQLEEILGTPVRFWSNLNQNYQAYLSRENKQ